MNYIYNNNKRKKLPFGPDLYIIRTLLLFKPTQDFDPRTMIRSSGGRLQNATPRSNKVPLWVMAVKLATFPTGEKLMVRRKLLMVSRWNSEGETFHIFLLQKTIK